MTGWRLTSCCSVACLAIGLVAGRLATPAPKASEKRTAASASSTTAVEDTEISRGLVRKDIVTTTTTRLDGTKTTVVRDRSIDSVHYSEIMSQSTAIHSANSTDSVTFASPRPTWSLGLTYAPSYAISPSPYNPKAFTPSIGYRFVGNVWIEAAYAIGSATPTLGVRLEF